MHEDLTPRELAVKYTDEKRYSVSESSVCRILSAEDLITAPAHVVIRAADEFRDKTTRPNELWQTDFTYLKVIGWGWYYLSTILDDFSRYVIAWKLCTTMRAGDVTETLELALEASGCDQPTVLHRPRLGRLPRLWLVTRAWWGAHRAARSPIESAAAETARSRSVRARTSTCFRRSSFAMGNLEVPQ